MRHSRLPLTTATSLPPVDPPSFLKTEPCADCQVSLASSEVYAWLGRSDALELMPVPQSALLKVQGVQRVCIDDVEHPCDPRQAHPLSCKCISMKLWLATMGRGWASPSVWRAEGSLHDCLFVDTRRKKKQPCCNTVSCPRKMWVNAHEAHPRYRRTFILSWRRLSGPFCSVSGILSRPTSGQPYLTPRRLSLSWKRI